MQAGAVALAVIAAVMCLVGMVNSLTGRPEPCGGTVPDKEPPAEKEELDPWAPTDRGDADIWGLDGGSELVV